MWFPIDTVTGVLVNGIWQVTSGPFNDNRQLEWISLIGPANSTCNVYLDTTFLDTTARGDFNRADYPNGNPVARGRQVILTWNTGNGTAPVVSLGYSDGTMSPGFISY